MSQAENYDHRAIEEKWQDRWKRDGIYQAVDHDQREKKYLLVEFPYPSGEGLHTGHVRSYTALDIIARKWRMEGKNVLYPMGWDAFGLPTENYAIKTGLKPQVITKTNTDNYRRQLQSLGLSFDWSREINTTDPEYYRWTQWIFLQLYRAGLAYKAKAVINWCPKDKIGLANEEVVAGKCERCGTAVEPREKEQWLLAITQYADRLDKDLDTVDFLPQIKTQQRNWIGRNEGALIKFKAKNSNTKKEIEVFTTRPDTIFGVTFLAVSTNFAKQYLNIDQTFPETEEKLGADTGLQAINPANGEAVPIWVTNYVLNGVGTGAIMGVPAHDERDFEFASKYNLTIKNVIVPVMGEPHDGSEFRRTISSIVYRKSDNKFLALRWKKFSWLSVPIGGIENDESPEEAAEREVLEETGYKAKAVRKLGGQIESHFFAENKNVWRARLDQPVLLELVDEKPEKVAPEELEKHEAVWLSGGELVSEITHKYNAVGLERYLGGNDAYCGPGKLVDSGDFSGMSNAEAAKNITKKFGVPKTTYKLRDWVFSRQRYWGEPIPMVWCGKCGWQPVPEKDLPVELPAVEKYQPTETGESPLAAITDWVKTKCPKCGGPARRETDTMPNWAGSSWYYLRYCDPDNKQQLAALDKLKYWTPVDWYNGGMEHTTLHLLYSRFWHKFLFDQGLVPTAEPYQKRTSHGLILAEGGVKMSKSKGNVVNPDSIVATYGADTLRLYEMFLGPFDQAVVWSTESIIGPRRFLEKVWRLSDKVGASHSNSHFALLLNQTIKKVSDDISAMSFNTAVAALMVLASALEKEQTINQADWEIFLKLLAPFAPHLAEELWSRLGHERSIHLEAWPQVDLTQLQTKVAKLIVQVNGIVRDTVEVTPGLSEVAIKELVLVRPKVAKWLAGRTPRKVVYLPDRLINFVV